MTVRRYAGHRLRCDSGFTLIELLASTLAGLIVCAAALAIIVSAVHFSRSDSERVDSDQEGSVAMEKVIQALNSSCVVGFGISPIVGAVGGTGLTGSTEAPASSGDSITFYSSLTDAPEIGNPNEIVIYLSSDNGPLDMATYGYVTSPGGTTGNYSATGSTFTLIPHADPPNSTSSQASTSPIFTYSGYNATTGALTSLSTGATAPLGATNAAATAEVGVNFQSQPSDGSTVANGAVDLADQAVLRLTAASNYPEYSTGSTGISPCA